MHQDQPSPSKSIMQQRRHLSWTFAPLRYVVLHPISPVHYKELRTLTPMLLSSWETR